MKLRPYQQDAVASVCPATIVDAKISEDTMAILLSEKGERESWRS